MHIKARIFLLSDLQEFFFRFRVGGRKKIKKNKLYLESTDQIKNNFRNYHFIFFLLSRKLQKGGL